MADDVVIPGIGTVAADEIGGKKFQRIKFTFGVDGVATDVSADNPLPVVQTGTPALPTGAATQTTLAAVLAKLIAEPATEATADRIADAVEAIEALTGATASEAAPSLVEGAVGRPDSLNLHGAKRVVLQSPDGGDLVPDESVPFHNAAVAAKVLVSATPAFISSWFLSNKHATDVGYLQIFDAAGTGDVTLGTTVPKHEIDLKAGQRASESGLSLKFDLGVVIAVTTTSHGATATGTGWGVNLGIVAG